MTTYLAARQILETTNNETAAWEVAQQDDGLNAEVTKEEWVAFVRNAIERDRQTAAAYAAWVSNG